MLVILRHVLAVVTVLLRALCVALCVVGIMLAYTLDHLIGLLKQRRAEAIAEMAGEEPACQPEIDADSRPYPDSAEYARLKLGRRARGVLGE